MAAIGGFRSDLSITRKTDANCGNVSAGVLFSKVSYQRKRWLKVTVHHRNQCRLIKYFISVSISFYCYITYH